MTKTLWYYVSNGGDGSANVRFTEDEQLAEFAEELQDMYEGWGESSVGSIQIDTNGTEIIFPENYSFIDKSEIIDEIEDNLVNHRYSDYHARLQEMLEELQEE